MGTLRTALVWLLHGAHRRAIAARRGGRTGGYVAYAVLSGVTFAAALVAAGGLVLALWHGGLWPVAVVLAAMIAFPFAGPLLIRHVFVPAGWRRAAQLAAHGAIASGKDVGAYGLVAAAWAHLRAPSAAGEAWLDARRAERVMVGDAEVVVAGLVALARGDTAAGRLLLQSTCDLRERHAAVRELAAEVLAAIDVEAGDWSAILARARDSDAWPASPLTFLLEGCAQRIAGDPAAPSVGALWARWLVAPRRCATRVLVGRCLAAGPRTSPRAPTERPTAAAAPPPVAPFPAAIHAHVVALRARKADRAALASAARAWDAALDDPETGMWLDQRAVELAAPPGAGLAAARELRVQVAADLAELAERAQLATLDDGSAIAVEIARQARGHRLTTLELAFAAWHDRARARAALPAIDEWRAFLALRASYDQAVGAGGLELRRLAFPHAMTAGNAVAAWLWNERKQYVLSHAVSCWLLREARAVGDASAIETESHNCMLDVPVRSD